MTFDPRNILVIDFGELGDVVMSLPALRAIRERFPHARITVAGGSCFQRHRPLAHRRRSWRAVVLLLDRRAPEGYVPVSEPKRVIYSVTILEIPVEEVYDAARELLAVGRTEALFAS